MATLRCTCGAEQDSSERFCSECQAYLWWDQPEEATADQFGGTTHVDNVRPQAPAADADAEADAEAEAELEAVANAATASASSIHSPPPAATATTTPLAPAPTPTPTAPPSAATETPLAPGPPLTPPQPVKPDRGPNDTGSGPSVSAFSPANDPTTPAEDAPASGDSDEQASPAPPSDRHAAAPEVGVEASEVTIGADGRGTLVLEITNTSSIVDGYDVVTPDAPPWLSATAEDAHLMPGESRKVSVTLSVRSEDIVLAQRIVVNVDVVSQADGARRASAVVEVIIPPSGPLMSLGVRPSVLRLQDVAAGELVLLLDNQSSNHPQTFDLSGSDPEGVVRFGFDRRRVTVRPGGVEEMVVEFSAPLPEPGTEVTRQLTITGSNPDGEATATFILTQRRRVSVDAPIQVRLSPAHVTSVNGADADFEVQLDNRGGDGPKSVVLSAHDAENRLTFEFASREVTVAAGTTRRVQARVRGSAPPSGTTETLPFSVVASNGPVDAEAQGELEATATPDPMSTALLHVPAKHMRMDGGAEHIEFDAIVDNRDGHDSMYVWLSGTSEDGEAVLRFHPSELSVAAYSTAVVHVSVNAPRPRAGDSITRDIEVQASNGRRAVSASAKITQTSPNYRPAWSRVLVIFGAVFAITGSIMVWVGTKRVLPTLELFQTAIATYYEDVEWHSVVEAAARVVVILLAIGMVLGLTGRAGGLSRECAVLIVLLTAGLLIGTMVRGDVDFRSPALGLFVVWFGALLGYIGGVLARPRQDL